ncbi:MAG: penicillin-binding protein 2 [bacterium]
MSILDEGFRAPGGSSRNRPHGNLGVLKIAVLGMFLVLGIRLGKMQLLDGSNYAERSRENHIVQKNILPTRGLITDRNGEPLVQNVGVYSATILPETLPEKEADRYQIYLKLQGLIGVSPLEVKAKVDDAIEAGKAYIAITVADNLPKEKALALDEVSVDMPGVSLAITPGRDYIGGEEFSHILGYIGPQFAEDAARLKGQNYQLNEPVGKDGLEARYEADLRGTVGFTAVEQDAYGHQITALQSKDPLPGDSLKLAIDAGLQRYVGQLLQDSLADTSGVWGDATVAAAVVMDPVTGEILAMNSLPVYDNNIWAENKIRSDELDRLVHDDKTFTLLNKALSSAAPGSTFKIVTASAGLEEGNVTANTTRYIPKTLEFKGENGVDYPLEDWRQHGNISLVDAIAWSSNIYMFEVAGGLPQERIPGLGKDPETSAVILADWARNFGFGQPTGIDIYGEASGTIPTPDWKRRIYSGPQFNSSDREWFISDTYFSAIGQGNVLATPLQVARMTAAIANGGKLVTPHLVNEVISPDGKTVRKIEPQYQDVGLTKSTIDTIRQGMWGSVNYGAGARANIPQAVVAGKTGTAEFNKPDGTKSQHAWFTGFAPFDNPEVVVTVYFDIGVGGDKAAPTAAKIFQYYFENVKR